MPTEMSTFFLKVNLPYLFITECWSPFFHNLKANWSPIFTSLLYRVKACFQNQDKDIVNRYTDPAFYNLNTHTSYENETRHGLEQWFSTWVQSNSKGSLCQACRFGRGLIQHASFILCINKMCILCFEKNMFYFPNVKGLVNVWIKHVGSLFSTLNIKNHLTRMSLFHLSIIKL